MNGTHPTPAPSLRELARPKGVTEGVSSDGSTGPMVYPQAIIGSEFFDRLRSSKYTPSVSHSLDSSLREGAGKRPHNVNHPPAGCCASGRVIFLGVVWGEYLPFNRVLAKPWGYGRFSSPLRRLRNFNISPCNAPLRNFRFPPQKRYRVGGGGNVWEAG